MSSPVFDGSNSASPTGSPPPAGTDCPESNPAQTVNAERVVVLPEFDARHRGRMKMRHRPDSTPTWSESERLAFLRRVQRVDERNLRP